MPYTLKPNKLFVKDPNGNGYLPQNVVTDRATSDVVADITAAGTAQTNSINTAGTTQTNRVNSAGATQITAIGNKAAELDSKLDEADEAISKIDALDDIIAGLRNLLDLVHPVGSVYISLDSTNPGTLFGGTWEQITGRFLLGTGTCAPNSDETFGTIKYPNIWNAGAGSTGGEDYHGLTVYEMPSHDHGILSGFGDKNDPAIDSDGFRYEWWGGSNRGYNNAFISSSGGNGLHNNMPPYLGVYMWKRTA